MKFAAYKRGFEVVGVDMSDFTPWIATVGKVAGGLTGGFASGLTGGALDLTKQGKGGGKPASSTEAEIKKALEAEQRKQALAKAEASARTTRLLLYGTLGVLGVGVVGTTIWAIVRK